MNGEPQQHGHTSSCARRPVPELPVGVVLRVLEHLPPNEVACTTRLVCKEAAQRFSSPQHRAVRLSAPVPPHAVGWRCGDEGLRRLTFHRKLLLLCTAAATGCETNLEVALRLVQPDMIPELMAHGTYLEQHGEEVDVGVAAARSGHAHLLPWLVAHRCPLDPHRTLEAVAEHCDLAALRATQQLLNLGLDSPAPAVVWAAAARSTAPDASEKLDWLTSRSGGLALPDEAGAAAASTGDVARLARMQQLGVSFGAAALAAALRGGHLPAAQWLVREGRCTALDPATRGERDVEIVCKGAAAGGSVAALRWLRDVHALALPRSCLAAAARQGQLEAVRHLVEECGLVPGVTEANATVLSGSVPTARCLLGHGARPSSFAYLAAALGRNLGMVEWLVAEARSRPLPSLPALVNAWGGPLGGPFYRRLALECGVRVEQHAFACELRRARGCAARPGADSTGGDTGCCQAVRLVLEASRSERGAQAVPGERGGIALAARAGYVQVMRYLHGAGVPYPASSGVAAAAEGGCQEAVEWTAAEDHSLGGPGGLGYLRAAKQGDRCTLQVLRRLGVPWDGLTRAGLEAAGAAEPVVEYVVGLLGVTGETEQEQEHA